MPQIDNSDNVVPCSDESVGEPLPLDHLLAQGLQPDFPQIHPPEFFDDAETEGFGDAGADNAEDSLDIYAKDAVAAKAAKGKRGKKNSMAVVDGTSVYQSLVDFGLLKKITDIVLAKAKVPWHLRSDARQAVHCMWASRPAKAGYVQNQLANYAYLSGKHDAFKLRRTIGAVVVIPGAAWRSGRDTPFMESIGAAINPRDIADYSDSLEVSFTPEKSVDRWMNDKFFTSRTEGLGLSDDQLMIAHLVLVERLTALEIAAQQEMTLSAVERILKQVTDLIQERDALVAKGKIFVPKEPKIPVKKVVRKADKPGQAKKKTLSLRAS